MALAKGLYGEGEPETGPVVRGRVKGAGRAQDEANPASLGGAIRTPPAEVRDAREGCADERRSEEKLASCVVGEETAFTEPA